MKYINIAKFSFFVVFCTIRKNRVPYTYKKVKNMISSPQLVKVTTRYFKIWNILWPLMTINDH